MERHLKTCTYFVCAFFLLIASTTARSETLFVPEGFSDFRSPGPIVVERPFDIVMEQLREFPELVGEGNTQMEIKSYLDDSDRLIIDLVESGLLDDSVSALNQRYMLVEKDSGKFKLWGYGYRQRCYRSDQPEKWVTDACL